MSNPRNPRNPRDAVSSPAPRDAVSSPAPRDAVAVAPDPTSTFFSAAAVSAGSNPRVTRHLSPTRSRGFRRPGLCRGYPRFMLAAVYAEAAPPKLARCVERNTLCDSFFPGVVSPANTGFFAGRNWVASFFSPNGGGHIRTTFKAQKQGFTAAQSQKQRFTHIRTTWRLFLALRRRIQGFYPHTYHLREAF